MRTKKLARNWSGSMLTRFVEFCRRNIEGSFAQNYQDLFALWVASGSRSGYFVEFGVMNGRAFSNSYMLEKLGWSGIVSEPHPGCAKGILANRTCHFSPLCVFDKTGFTVPFRIVNGRPAMSGIGETQLNDDKAELRNNFREVNVQTITLNDLLSKYKAPETIDFVSIDTEGSEERILGAFDFGAHRIRSFCIEHNYIQQKTIATIMHRQGYVRLFPELSAHDDWWVLDSEIHALGDVDLELSRYFVEIFDNGLEKRRQRLERIAEAAESRGRGGVVDDTAYKPASRKSDIGVNRTVEPQIFDMLPDDRRIRVESLPNKGDVASGAIYSVQPTGTRDIPVEPFCLLDPSETCPSVILNYAAGRTVRVPESYVTAANNLRVSGNGLLATASGYLLHESCIRPHHGFPMGDGRVEVRSTNPVGQVTKRISEPTIILNGVYGLHFSHWIYDNFSRLTFLRRLMKSFAGHKIAVGFGDRRGGWCKPGTVQYECLSFLGFSSDDIIMIPEHDWFEFEHAIVMSEVNNFVPPAARIWNAPEIFPFYDEVFDLAGLERRQPWRRVNLSRMDDSNRRCANEVEVVELTESWGFQHKTLAGMSMADQMQFFSEIAIAVGPVGNNLMTLFAMQPGSKLVTFFPPKAAHVMAYYQNYCSARGIDLYAVCGHNERWEGSEGPLNNLRWDVDMESVGRLIADALGGSSAVTQ